MLASVFGETALPEDCFAGCEAQHQQTAFAKQKRQDVVFCVNTARLPFRKTASQDAKRSTSRRRPAKRNSVRGCPCPESRRC